MKLPAVVTSNSYQKNMPVGLCLWIIVMVLLETILLPRLLAAPAQNADEYRLRNDRYGERKEGIKKMDSRPVSSNRIVMVAATIESEDNISEMPAELTVALFAPQEIDARLQVKYEPRLYFMDPLRKVWGPGLASFKWPTAIMNRQKVPANALSGLASRSINHQDWFFPLLIYAGKSPKVVRGYRFVVSPRQDMKIYWTIYDPVSDRAIAKGLSADIIFEDQTFPFTWNGRDVDGRPVAEGTYILQLKGHALNSRGGLQEIKIPYYFYHKPLVP